MEKKVSSGIWRHSLSFNWYFAGMCCVHLHGNSLSYAVSYFTSLLCQQLHLSLPDSLPHPAVASCPCFTSPSILSALEICPCKNQCPFTRFCHPLVQCHFSISLSALENSILRVLFSFTLVFPPIGSLRVRLQPFSLYQHHFPEDGGNTFHRNINHINQTTVHIVTCWWYTSLIITEYVGWLDLLTISYTRSLSYTYIQAVQRYSSFTSITIRRC
jgi:hypothetical protein